MTSTGATQDRVLPGWTGTRWAAAAMAPVLLVLVLAPARVWLLAVLASAGDDSVVSGLRVFWIVMGLAPTVVGVVAWLLLRGRPPRQRFVLAGLWAAAVGLVTILPITPYVFSI